MNDDVETIDLSSKDEDGGLPTVYPTLVIGVGGTGVKTLRFLRRRLTDEFGSSVREKSDLVQLLGVDTVPLENRSSVEALHQHEYAYIGGFNANRVIENLDRFQEIQRWWDWDPERGIPLGFISTGAKQLRTIGRLALYRRFHIYNSRVEAKLGRLSSIDAHQVSHDLHLRKSQDQIHLPHVFIVGSLAGGTGSGAFLDVAAHLRRRLQDQTRIIGILVMPSVFEEDIPSLLQQRRIRANAYAALTELDYFQSGTGPFSTKFPQQDAFQLHGSIFTNVFLLDRSNAAGFQLGGQEDVQRFIADAIFEMSVTPTAYHVWEMDANVSRERVDGRSLAYSALGYSSMTVDSSSLQAWAQETHAMRLHRAMFQMPTSAGSNPALTTANKIKQEISDLANYHSHDLTENKADPRAVYQNNMRGDCHVRVVRALYDNLTGWGIDGALEFVHALATSYTPLLDSTDPKAPSYGQIHDQELTDQLQSAVDEYKKTTESFFTTAGKNLNNRKGIDPQQKARRDNAEAAVREARKNLDHFRLLRLGVAPDLVVLLAQLTDELNVCRNRLLGAWHYNGQTPNGGQRFDYPLRTFIDFSGQNGANGAMEGDGVIQKSAAELLGKWIAINNPTASKTLVQWIGGKNEDIQFEIRSQAFQLTRARAKNRLSLYELLKSQSRREPERTHDQLRDFIRRCVPYCRLDFDRHNFSEKNIEPTYRICLPKELKKEFELRGSFFWALSTGDYDFQPTDKPGRSDRMEALCVTHGYPLWVFADLPDMFTEYISEDLGKSPLHLQCSWRFMMRPIHILDEEEKRLMKVREPLFRQLCRGTRPPGSRRGPAPATDDPEPTFKPPTT